MVFFSSPQNLQEKELPRLHIVPWRGGDVGLGKQMTHCFGRQTGAKRWGFSFVGAEAKGARDWQGCDLRAGMQEDLHCEL